MGQLQSQQHKQSQQQSGDHPRPVTVAVTPDGRTLNAPHILVGWVWKEIVDCPQSAKGQGVGRALCQIHACGSKCAADGIMQCRAIFYEAHTTTITWTQQNVHIGPSQQAQGSS
jgi:hypothetical protein